MGPFFYSLHDIYSLTTHIVGFSLFLFTLKSFSTEVSDLWVLTVLKITVRVIPQ